MVIDVRETDMKRCLEIAPCVDITAFSPAFLRAMEAYERNLAKAAACVEAFERNNTDADKPVIVEGGK